MRLEHENLAELKAKILEIIAKYVDLKTHQVFFFGSRVTGRGDQYSDIDVGIEGEEPVGLSKISQIREDLEDLRTLYKIDVVDFADVSDSFRQTAKAKTEIISI